MSLSLLAEALRDRTKWPDKFSWHYEIGSRCALGLARQLWDKAKFEGISELEFDRIFSGAHLRRGIGRSEVTPEMIACDIEAHLAKELVALPKPQ